MSVFVSITLNCQRPQQYSNNLAVHINSPIFFLISTEIPRLNPDIPWPWLSRSVGTMNCHKLMATLYDDTFSCSRAKMRDWLCVAVVLNESFLCSSSVLLCSTYLPQTTAQIQVNSAVPNMLHCYRNSMWHMRSQSFTCHTQPFYSSLDFVRDNLGELVPEGTFCHLLDFLVQNEDNIGTNNPDGLSPHPD